jgi:hypothetical protein
MLLLDELGDYESGCAPHIRVRRLRAELKHAEQRRLDLLEDHRAQLATAERRLATARDEGIAEGVSQVWQGAIAALGTKEPLTAPEAEVKKAIEAARASLIDEAIKAAESRMIDTGPSGCTGYEKRGAFNDGVQAAIAALESFPQK